MAYSTISLFQISLRMNLSLERTRQIVNSKSFPAPIYRDNIWDKKAVAHWFELNWPPPEG